MKKLLLSFFLLIAILSIGATVQAQYVHVIPSFTSDIDIQKDGSMRIQETIIYDFGVDERRGIFRNIPFITRNEAGERYQIEYDIESVTDETGEKYKYETYEEGDDWVIKIGDANKTITGVHTYVITYTAKGAITYFSDHDELYWNITGNSWDVPILSTNTTISVPMEDMRNEVQIECWTGIEGANESNCFSVINQYEATFMQQEPLEPGEGMTVVVGFPKDTVAVMEAKKVVDFFDTIFGKLTALGIALGALWWYIIYPLWLPIRWWLNGRDVSSHHGKTTAAFEPPVTKSGRHLTPAETGTLVDEFAHMREISALIVNLAQRGYLTIVEKGKKDYELVKNKEQDEDLQEFEKIFLTELFAVQPKVNLKKAEDLYSVVTTVQKELYDSLVHEGFFPHNPDKIRKFYIGMTVAAMSTFNILLMITSSIFGRIMPRKTLEGVHQSNVARSLKNFLQSQERQLNFQGNKQLMFEKLLPYAIAFGVEKNWAERFKDIQMKQPDWYQGSSVHTFNSQSFTNSVNSSMNSFSKAATPTSSSTGHSSGFSGGSSGGGGGGGGGGSW